MAEHYGVVPKKFTKAWWPYFWMYYKWQTIGIVFVILCVGVTVFQCFHREKYDAVVNYVSADYYKEDTVQALEDELSKYIQDVDGDGNPKVFVQQMNITNQDITVEQDYTLQMKHDVELTDSTSFLYIYDNNEVQLMAGRENSDSIYDNIMESLNIDFTDDKVVKTASEKPIAVSVSGSKILGNLGIKTDDLYLAIKTNGDGENKEQVLSHQNAVDMAAEILK